MRLALRNGTQASNNDILLLEELVGHPLDHEYLSFVANNDGAIPEQNSFAVAENAQMGGITRFLHVSEIPTVLETLELADSAQFPFALCEGGNYLLMSLKDPVGVFFWDHETNEIDKVAETFKNFMENLTPFSIDDIDKTTYEYGEIWVDPDFKPVFD